MKKICVIGLGYIGLPTASMLATHGFDVLGVDINSEIVKIINNGGIHIEEPGLHTLVQAAIKSGKLKAATEPKPADIFIIAVPTPITEEKKADLSYIKFAAKSIATLIYKDNLVILESTSPPGTCRDILEPIFKSFNLKNGRDYYLAHCPERVLPGYTLKELIQNDRIIGGIDKKSAEKAAQFYKVFVEGDIHITDSTTAEMVKLMENTYRDVNIALANELAIICEKLGINAWEVIRLANLHPRVNLHTPGPGVGGHCIAVDPWFIVEKNSVDTKIITLSRKINDSMPEYTLAHISKIVGGIDNPKIAILGVTYKGNIDDTRESPALKIVTGLEKNGIKYSIYDPHVREFKYKLSSLQEAFSGADCAVILANHDEFRFLHPAEIGKLMRNKVLFDTKYGVDHNIWKQNGFAVYCLGVGSKNNNSKEN
jgi:UDP-N-acetyl-D-mannosaminuronic acid dehydrogenase